VIGATEFQAGALDKRYFGVVVGVVTRNADPDHEGCVSVKFPWYDDQTQTEWCRVVYPYAGPGHGFLAVPEKDSEVLVAFEHGDMRRPYVLGGLFNGVDAPPTYRDEDDIRDEKLLRTRGGHRLLFRDTKNDTLVELTTAGGHELTLRDQGKSGGALVTARTNGGHSLEMDDAGKKVTLTTSAGQKVVLEESGAITIKADKVKVEASQIELGSVASQKVVLGDAFMALFNAHVHTSSVPTTPTSPPVTPMLPMLLSQVTKTG
jgi:uncharacterized protein involved in type VI secretion and phage assembly